MRQKIVAGNWKMHKTLEEGITLVKDVLKDLPVLAENHTVIFGTPYIHLKETGALAHARQGVYVAAQNCHTEESGAYTGEISVPMIKSIGTQYVIIGHSERRQYFSETDETVAKKTERVLAHGLKPIVCVGEQLHIREAGTHFELIRTQLEKGVFHVSATDIKHVVIAYEPVWAIGTGKTASDAQAQEVHAHIRALVKKQYGDAVAEDMTILYGGSCKPDNAAGLFAQPDVDGGLIGGASLKAADFLGIIAAL